MINELLLMNGYGIYVWTAFVFTLFNFVLLYIVINIQYIKEKNKFVAKFGTLNSERASFARSQRINREILSTNSNI